MDDLQSIIARSLCNVAEDIVEPEYLIEQNGIGVMPIEGLVAIKGKAKNGKSQAVTILMAAVLGDKTFGFISKDIADNGKVLFIDTEQSRAETIPLGRRVHYLLDWDEKTPNERFSICNIRNEDFTIRLNIIEKLLEQVNPILLVIDGIADLIADINSSIEAPKCVGQLLTLSSKFHCCIMAVIHENKGHDDKAMRGHIGTWLLNKASDIFAVKKEKQNGTFILTHEDSRGKTIQDIVWKREGENGNELTPLGENPKETRIKKRFCKLLQPNEEVRRVDLQKKYTEEFSLSEKSFDNDFKEACKRGILMKTENNLYKLP